MQTAITFKCPPYKNLEIESDANVMVELRRPSDGSTSEAVAFTYAALGTRTPTFSSVLRAFSRKTAPSKSQEAALAWFEPSLVRDKLSAMRAFRVAGEKKPRKEAAEDELERIYEDTRAKLELEKTKATAAAAAASDVDVRDNQTYTSLQMAMRNPLELVGNDAPPLPAKREPNAAQKLPPLPPKRLRKAPSMPVLAPSKTLPSVPGAEQSKGGLFAKLFARKNKQQKISESTGEIRFELDNDKADDNDDELTEAEHYALYTDMAPRATASEFDEMSFYYSPVEGGKIVEGGVAEGSRRG